ncbi:alpha/beta fold hydrolase [Mycolicibacterium mucogenicum]|uniref:alpha/beta hydrolase n=1 Tax=Mycolicibacterium mucogenicum TaxID=56689 RepID=UPI00226A9404|nr:alpha/beta fold hydrolase [Mycolicibacterium mucogenicum]MCX8560806.1 alpha/beta fold hydrolase [Mycolicibacterium mucogenicum]
MSAASSASGSPVSPVPRMVRVGDVMMSGLLAEAETPRAVIVAVHGGGSSAAYFDCPGHPRLSLLRTAAALGYTVVALDRPGYGASGAYPDAVGQPAQRVALAYGAVDAMLGPRDRGAGVFLLGHSNGCELALRIAVDERADRADVFGIALAGTGLRYEAAALEMLKSASVTHRPPGLRELLWQPAELYPPLTNTPNARSGARYEAAMVQDWPRNDFPALAADVQVPVHFTVAEHERVWQSDPDALAAISGLFTAAPRVTVHRQVGAGHNISVSVGAAAYHLTILAFIEECLATQAGTTVTLEVG